MSDREEWSDWIEHDGMGCPRSVAGRVVHVIFEAPDAETIENPSLLVDAVMACCESWNGAKYEWAGGYTARWMGKKLPMRWITRYRVKGLGAAAELREMIETLPAPSRQKEDA